MPKFELRGKVQLDGSKWKAGLNQAKNDADKWGRQTAGVIKGHLTQAFAVGTLFRSSTALMDKAATVSRDASKLDISPEMFQHLEYAAKSSKVEIDEVREALLELSVKQQEVAEGSEDVTKAFQRFGLEFDDVVNTEPIELFKSLANSVAKGENSTDLIADMDTLLSDDGKRLIPAFKSGFFDKVSESQSIGAPLSNEQINDLKNTNEDALREWQKILAKAGKGYAMLNEQIENKLPFLTLPFDADARRSVQNASRLQSELDNKELNNIHTTLKKIDQNTAPLNQ